MGRIAIPVDENGNPLIDVQPPKKRRKKSDKPITTPASFNPAAICSRIGKTLESVNVPPGVWDLTPEENNDVLAWYENLKENAESEAAIKFFEALSKVLIHVAIISIFAPKIFITASCFIKTLKGVKKEGNNNGNTERIEPPSNKIDKHLPNPVTIIPPSWRSISGQDTGSIETPDKASDIPGKIGLDFTGPVIIENGIGGGIGGIQTA
jgi:hypothetical protein